jgi:site-specific DNA-methyltransferase (adenine-specific)
MTYGSRIDGNSANPKESFKVREVLSPARLLLDNGQYISLLGIKEIPGKNGEAIEFLKKLIKGNKVFIRSDDSQLQDSESVYLYLNNKTFVNIQLIKNKLVEVDSEGNFKYKEKFLKYSMA